MKNINKWKNIVFLIPFIYFGYFTIEDIVRGYGLISLVDLYFNGILILVLIFFIVRKVRVITFLDLFVLIGFVIYLYVLHHMVTYIPISYYITQKYIGNPYIQSNLVNLVPFKTIYETFTRPIFAMVTIIQIFGNALMLAPFSFSLLYLKMTERIKTAIVLTFLLSLGIEVIQFLLSFINSAFLYGEGSGRSTDVDDIILNTIGGVIGSLFYILLKTVKKNIYKSNLNFRHMDEI
jgi:glycopeptide antibiotics resistance protein